jgi:hypothetical protein
VRRRVAKRWTRIITSALMIAVGVLALQHTVTALFPSSSLDIARSQSDASDAAPRRFTVASYPVAPTPGALGLRTEPILEAPPVAEPVEPVPGTGASDPPAGGATGGSAVSQVIGVDVPCVEPEAQHCAAVVAARDHDPADRWLSIPALGAIALVAAVRPARARTRWSRASSRG